MEKNKFYEILFIGAGPGNIQAAIKLKELGSKNKYLILEKNNIPGSSFKKYPVHKNLISNNKVMHGEERYKEKSERLDWNSLITEDKSILFSDYSKDFYPDRKYFVQMIKDLVISKNLNVKYNISCENVIHDGKNFIVNTNEGTYHCKFLVCGTGVVPKKPKIKGIELTTSYAEMKSKEFYRGKIVLIIGKGNSGLECAQDIINEASYISCASPNSINFAYKTHYIGDVRIVNSILIENYLLKQNASVLDCKILDIKKVENKFLVKVHYTHANDEIEEIIFDEVVDATGFKSEDSLLKNFNINYIDGKYPEIDENFQSVSIPNLFFSGIQTHGLDYKKTSGGFIHGFRYLDIIQLF